jgi:hypothetical protein
VATITAMIGEVWGYYGNFGEQWLLAMIGSVILVCDIWIVLEGLRLLVGTKRGLEWTSAT